MILQIAIGSGLGLFATLIAGGGFLVLEIVLNRIQLWLLAPPHRRKLMLLLCGAMLWILFHVTVAVWIWAIALRLLGVFVTLEASIYFSLVAFTTLGFGDILLPMEWRLLSGMAAVNGLLMIGILTAMLIETMRRVRAIQIDGSR